MPNNQSYYFFSFPVFCFQINPEKLSGLHVFSLQLSELYLRMTIHPAEIKKRIATAKDAFQKLSLILKNRNISMTTKFRVLKTYVWSTLTYGCECWTITSDIEKKIEAAEMWFIRRMLRISWAEKKTNVNVLREGNVQRSLLKTIRKRQMEFLGHVCRRRGLEFLSLTGKVEGKRDRGKQRITFLDSLCNSATGGQSKGLNFLKLSDDRDVWRGMVANVCSRSGT